MDKSLVNQGELFEVNIEELQEAQLNQDIQKSTKKGVCNLYEQMNEQHQSNIGICTNVFKKNGLAYASAPKTIKQNKTLIKLAISNDAAVFKYIPSKILDDKEIASEMIKIDPCRAFTMLPNYVLLKEDVFNLLLEKLMIRKLTMVPMFGDRIFSKPLDKMFAAHPSYIKFICRLSKSYAQTYQSLPKELQHNKEIILNTISANFVSHTDIIKKLPDDILDKAFCLKALKAGACFQFFPSSIKDDIEFCKAAITKSNHNADYLADKFWENKEIAKHYLSGVKSIHHFRTKPNKLCRRIERHHANDKDINYLLAKSGYEISNKSQFQDSKKMVKVFLDNIKLSPRYEIGKAIKTDNVYKAISPRLKKDKDIASKAMQMSFSVYNHIDKSLKHDVALMKRVINGTPAIFCKLDWKLRDNKELAIAAVKRRDNYDLVSSRLKNDIKFVQYCLERHHSIFKNVPKKFKSDYDTAAIAIKSNISNLQHVGEKIRSDKKFMEQAILMGGSLKFASRELKKNKDFVKFAADQHNSNLHFADISIKHDKKYLLKNFPLYLVFRYCSSKILQDKEIFIDGLNLDPRNIYRRGMSTSQILNMSYEGIKDKNRFTIYVTFVNRTGEDDIFLLAKAKKVICGVQ